jgi:hypothetical protein
MPRRGPSLARPFSVRGRSVRIKPTDIRRTILLMGFLLLCAGVAASALPDTPRATLLTETGDRLHALLNDSLTVAMRNGQRGRLRPSAVSRQRPQTLPLSLASLLEPFAQKLIPPFTTFVGDAGTPLNATEIPTSMDEVINGFLYSSERRSAVFRLEHLIEEQPAATSIDAVYSRLGPLADVLRPFHPLGRGKGKPTAHMYISNGGASALENHTDVTEILVLQLFGRKEWMYCTSQESRLPPWIIPKTTLKSKLSQCATYSAVEMADETLDCARIVTGPGDMLFLPRRTVHNARAVAGHISVHLTVGVATGVALLDPLPHRRRLEECASGCDHTCDPSCDGSSCDGAGCDDASCDGSSCDGAGCDDASCGECSGTVFYCPAPSVQWPVRRVNVTTPKPRLPCSEL